MKSIEQWLDAYGVSHKNPKNKSIHWICVPLIMMSIIGMFWAIPAIGGPLPVKALGAIDLNNWGIIFMALALLYYFFLSWRLAIGMIFVVSMMIILVTGMEQFIPLPIWLSSLIIFVLAWIGQFIGHKIEGAKPSFFEDLQFLLIGPLWLLSFIYKKFGISISNNS